MRWAEAIRALGASPCRENDDVRASLLHEASDLGGYTGRLLILRNRQAKHAIRVGSLLAAQDEPVVADTRRHADAASAKSLTDAMPTAKPTNIDAQRILAIMDELKEKLTFLSFVSPQVLAGLQGEDGSATVEILGPELMKCFAEQLRLEDLYVMASNGEGGDITPSKSTMA
ncbi:hypothetical protein AK812_SmicGene29524 [Symbiodinium microadriaticum]|uniref:Uncharacterized protein n=1 Tax=Symbiodinium microadriaticum TaxID=2951 RepID=A0A1Q9D1N9_SYMMI|nr:hypothetical protein AK812_SmicGene29524 [Symbiodinium microadriaticum]